MKQNATFVIDLSDFEMSSKERVTLEKELQRTTVKFLKSSEKGVKYLDGKVSLTPHPDDPYPYPWPYPWPWPGPFPIDVIRIGPPYFPGFRAIRKEILRPQTTEFDAV